MLLHVFVLEKFGNMMAIGFAFAQPNGARVSSDTTRLYLYFSRVGLEGKAFPSLQPLASCPPAYFAFF
jgi:hypothetical protein